MNEQNERGQFNLNSPDWTVQASKTAKANAAIARNKVKKGERLRAEEERRKEQFSLGVDDGDVKKIAEVPAEVSIEVTHRMLEYNSAHPEARKTYDEMLREYLEEQK